MQIKANDEAMETHEPAKVMNVRREEKEKERS